MPKETLTEKQVNDVLNAYSVLDKFDFTDFADSYRNTYYNTGFFTPDTINQQMKTVSMNPIVANMQDLEDALLNPEDSETILSQYAQQFEITNMMYKRLSGYYPNMASFNLSFTPIGIKRDSEFNSPAFKEDLGILEDFLASFDYKQEFAKAMRQMFRKGVYYTVLRSEGQKKTLQELPMDYCKITGRFDYGLLFDFNMDWFNSGTGVDIDMYPRVFKKMYRDVVSKMTKKYNPAKGVNVRASTYNSWHQTSPKDGFWCFKLDPELINILPYYSGILEQINYQPVIRKLQQDKYFIEASKLLVGIVGMNKDTKSGQVSNQTSMTPDVLGKFLGVARKGLNEQIGLVVLPVDEIKPVEFETTQQNVDTDYTNSIVRQSVASSAPLFGTEKLNSHQSKLASAVDINIVESLYPMFEDFMEYNVNSQTKKYKFSIKFNDENIPDQRAERFQKWDKFSNNGIVDLQLAARCVDQNVFEFMNSVKMSNSCFNITKQLKFLVDPNSNTKQNIPNNKGEKVGRPSNENDPTADNDSTEASRARGSNDLK